MENTFGSQFFTIQKKPKNTTPNQENKNSFQKTTKWCSLCFQRPFSRIVFKNRNQTGLLFECFMCFFITKKNKNRKPNVFSLFSFSLFLRTENSFQKQKPNWPLMFYIQKSPKIRVRRSKEHYWFLMALFQHSNQEAKVIRDKAK